MITNALTCSQIIFGMALSSIQLSLLGIPQERIAQKLQESRETIRRYLVDLVTWPNQPNADLKKGFAVARVADKHGWSEPLVWSIALEGKDDLQRFKALNWGLRTWDLWNWNDCIDFSHLMNLLSADSVEGLRASHYSWVEEKLKQNTNKRDAEWTESIGVGSRSFLRAIKEKLGYRARGRSIIEGNEPSTYQLREPQSVYGAHHHGDMNNLHPWDI